MKYISFLTLLSIALFLNSYGHSFTISSEQSDLQSPQDMTKASEKPQSQGGTKSSSKPHSNVDLHVINIVIDKMDKNAVYSKDGRSFALTDSTRIINNHNPDVKLQTGELFFSHGKLVTIIIK